MEAYYNGEHQVFFGQIGDINPIEPIFSNYVGTWDTWHLIPVSRPVIAPPPLRKNMVDVPGANGSIDITDAPRGFPVYGNRTGSLEFYVDHSRDWGTSNGTPYDWTTAYHAVCAYLHGRQTKMYLADEPYYYYYGRFAVNSWKSDKQAARITIDYDVEPYVVSEARLFDTAVQNPVTRAYVPIGDLFDNTKFVIDFANGNTLSTQFADSIVGNMPVIPMIMWTRPGVPGIDYQPDEDELYVEVYREYLGYRTDKIKVEGEVVTGSADYTLNPKMQIVNPFNGAFTTFTFYYKDRQTGEFRVPESGTVYVNFAPGRL